VPLIVQICAKIMLAGDKPIIFYQRNGPLTVKFRLVKVRLLICRMVIWSESWYVKQLLSYLVRQMPKLLIAGFISVDVIVTCICYYSICFVTRLQIWDKMFVPLHCLNFGVGGDQTQHVLWRLTNGELDGFAPKVWSCVLLNSLVACLYI